MPSAVEKFLAEKRAQQEKLFTPQVSSLAPPMHERYGLSSGEYTGKGKDGITQPMNPTQGRIDTNGKPYVVDENELLVNDSATLNDYGGAQALDKFIQSNRPGRQYACGGVPAKRYYTGGIPSTRQRAISGEQMSMMTDIQKGIRKFQDGGVSTGETRDRTLPIPDGSYTQIPDGSNTQIPNNDPNLMINPVLNQTPDILKNPDMNISGQQNQLNVKDPVIQTPNQLTNPNLQQGFQINNPDFSTLNSTKLPDYKKSTQLTQNTTPFNVDFKVPDAGGQVGTSGDGTKKYSPNETAEMINQRQLARMGSAQESQRAAEAQRGLQAGLSDREVQGRGAISDVGRREALSSATADFAINQSQKAEEMDKFNQQMEMQQKQIDTQQEQWNKQFDTQKQKDSLNTLLQAGDYKGASKLFSDIYGQSIDFSVLENAQNADKFNEGFNNMTGLIASGTKWEDAVKIMQKDGSFEKMGMTEGDLQKFYAQAQLNNDPLYKSVSMVDKWVESNLISQDEADDFIATLMYTLTNPQGLTVSDGYAVKGKDGKEVGFFTSEAEADAYINANPNAGYVKGAFEKNHVGLGSGTPIKDPVKIPDTQIGDTEAYGTFIEALPNTAPQDAADWLSEEIYLAAGKPESWDDFQKWSNDTTKVKEYFKKKYNSETPDLTNPNMTQEDMDFVLYSIKQNTAFFNEYKAPEEPYNRIKDFQGWKINTDGSYTIEGTEHPDSVTVQMLLDMKKIMAIKNNTGRILEINTPNGKQNIMIMSKESTGDGFVALTAMDINTGAKFTIRFRD